MGILLTDGNAFAIIGAGRTELKRQGRHDEVSTFTEEATSGDYDQVIRTLIKWFPDVELG